MLLQTLPDSTGLLKATDWYLPWDCTSSDWFPRLPDMAGYTRADPQGPINACSHHPPLPKLGVIKTLNHWAENVPAKDEDREKRERAHRELPRNVWLPGISFKYKNKEKRQRKEETPKDHHYLTAAVSEKPAEALQQASPTCDREKTAVCCTLL